MYAHVPRSVLTWPIHVSVRMAVVHGCAHAFAHAPLVSMRTSVRMPHLTHVPMRMSTHRHQDL